MVLMAAAFMDFLNLDLPGWASHPCTLPISRCYFGLLTLASVRQTSILQLPGAPGSACWLVWQRFAHILTPALQAVGSLSAFIMIPLGLGGTGERKGEPYLANRRRSREKLWIWN